MNVNIVYISFDKDIYNVVVVAIVPSRAHGMVSLIEDVS